MVKRKATVGIFSGRSAGLSNISKRRKMNAKFIGPVNIIGPRNKPNRGFAPSMQRQLRALVASKKKDAADVVRTSTPLTATTISCLTSTTAFATAASGTGLLDMDGDECLINSVRIKGYVYNAALLDLDTAGNSDIFVRQIVVWFNKPLLVASAAGTLPPITEVLIADTMDSLPVTDAANGGRFRILSNRTWNIGQNTYQSAIAAGGTAVHGPTLKLVDYRVKVNKMVKFKVPAVSGAPAGHYDSDVGPGQIDRGLLVMYTQVLNNNQSGTPAIINNTRLNYTG